MGKRIEYQIVGRYMNGAEVTGYMLQSIEDNKAKRYSREQVCYLVGKGQVTNCSGQIYQDKVLLRGVGMSLEDLPVQQESGEVKKASGVHNIKKTDTGTDIMTKLFITQSITDGRNVVGYVVSNAGGGVSKLSREQVLQLAKEGKLGNASFQTSNGKPILRGVGINLNELPSVRLNPPAPTQQAAPVQPEKTQSKSKVGIGALSSGKERTTAKKAKVIDAGGYEYVKKAYKNKVYNTEGEVKFEAVLKDQLPTGIKLEDMFISRNSEYGHWYFDVNILVREQGMGIGYTITTNTLTQLCDDIFCCIPNAPYDNSEKLQNISYNFNKPIDLCRKIIKEIVDGFIKAGA